MSLISRKGCMVGAPQRQRRPEPMGSWELKLIREKRALGASWDALAAMIGRPAPDVRAQWERMEGATIATAPKPERVARIGVDPGAGEASTATLGGETVNLAGMSQAMLAILQALSGGGLATHDQLGAALARVYGRPAAPGTLAYQIMALRKHLPPALTIRSIAHRGYVLEGGTLGAYESPAGAVT